MARDQAASFKSAIVSQAPSLIASAERIGTTTISASKRARMAADSWQSTCWSYMKLVGEYRYAATWVGNLLSKARLIAVDAKGKELTEGPAYDALQLLFDNEEGRREMLRQLGVHFTVAGEAYLIGSESTSGVDDWFIAASSQVTLPAFGSTSFTIDAETYESPLAIRMWKPDPEHRSKAESPSQAIIPVLRQIHGIEQRVDAEINSRLAGAGMLLLPQEITFPKGPVIEGQAEDVTTSQTSADKLVATLLRTMALAIANGDDPSSLVPIILQMPGEYIDKVQHLTFWSELSEQAGDLSDRAIRRLALGMDMPPEILTGTGDLNHWSSWQVEEASIKAHTEPLLAVITSALSTGWLRPYLEVAGVSEEEALTFSISADTSKMRLRPNRSAEALELYDRGELSGEALLRENGFEPVDRMDDAERATWLIKKIAQGSTTPELVEAAAKELGALLTPIVRAQVPERTQEERPTPSLIDHPRREPPVQEDAIAAAAYVHVERAVERAGNRIKTKLNGRPVKGLTSMNAHTMVQVQEDELNALLDGAWSSGGFAMTAGLNGDTPEKFATTLDRYTRSMLLHQRPHDFASFRDYLSLAEDMS